jgi:hypothetical protein
MPFLGSGTKGLHSFSTPNHITKHCFVAEISPLLDAGEIIQRIGTQALSTRVAISGESEAHLTEKTQPRTR